MKRLLTIASREKLFNQIIETTLTDVIGIGATESFKLLYRERLASRIQGFTHRITLRKLRG